jgi:plastocyanin
MKPFTLAAALAALLAPSLAAGAPGATPTATVHIRNFAYVPQKLSVARGTAVRFVNDDDEAHTVTATDRSFDSGGLDTGDTWTHRFTAAGTTGYFCALHPYMRGTVVVTP